MFQGASTLGKLAMQYGVLSCVCVRYLYRKIRHQTALQIDTHRTATYKRHIAHTHVPYHEQGGAWSCQISGAWQRIGGGKCPERTGGGWPAGMAAE